MTITADNKKRVTLPVEPGERFDVLVVKDGQFILTRVQSIRSHPIKVTVQKIGRHSVARLDRPVDETTLQAALAEFP